MRYVSDGNAVGKDWPGWFVAGATTSGTGLHVDTPLAGAALGLREGVELHLLGLPAAVRRFPPSLALPFLPEIPGGWCGEPDDAMPHPPTRHDRRLELAADTGAGGPTEVEAIWEVDGASELLLVDAASGCWMRLHFTFGRDKATVADGAGESAVDNRVVFASTIASIREQDGNRSESFVTCLRHDQETAIEVPFGRALARVHQQRLDTGRARLRVTITRQAAP